MLSGMNEVYAGMAQSVERRIGSAEVPGPIPGASFKGSGSCRSLFASP